MNKVEKYSLVFGFIYVSAMSMYMIKTQIDFRNKMKNKYPNILNAFWNKETSKPK
jgi:hypothetical protein